jgi:hypothetical protein
MTKRKKKNKDLQNARYRATWTQNFSGELMDMKNGTFYSNCITIASWKLQDERQFIQKKIISHSIPQVKWLLP